MKTIRRPRKSKTLVPTEHIRPYGTIKGKSLSSMYESAKNFVNKVVNGRQTLSPKVEKLLSEVGDANILSAEIGRTPVQAVITGIIKIVSSTPYEKLFHLFIILQTTKGEVRLEKNEVINMEKSGMPKDAESMKVPSIPSGLTVKELVDNTSKYMGSDFLGYSANNNNCQDFQMAILNSNHMNTPELTAFVKQDTASIFKDSNFRKLANTVTDLAGRFDVVRQGGSLYHHKISNELNNHDIDKLMLHYLGKPDKDKAGKIKNYHGCYVKDRLPQKLKNGFYFINLNGSSHWTGLCKDGTKYYYFDSYGFVAPQEVEDHISKEYIWSDKDIQTYASSACGFYVTGWIRCMASSKNKEEAYRKFINLFQVNKPSNEKILSRLL